MQLSRFSDYALRVLMYVAQIDRKESNRGLAWLSPDKRERMAAESPGCSVEASHPTPRFSILAFDGVDARMFATLISAATE